MSFTILQKNTTITASSVNNNFLHVGQSHLLPNGGSSLAATTATYNLGSDNYKWDAAVVNNIYATSVDVTTINHCQTLLDSYTIDEQHTATSRIEFTGLNGDSYIHFEAMIYVVNPGTTTLLYLNGDSSTSNYSYVFVYWEGSTSTYSMTYTSYPYAIMYDTSCTVGYGRVLGNLKTGIRRKLLISSMIGTDSQASRVSKHGIKWTNTSSTITSLVFYGQFNTGASIKIWGYA